MHQAITDINWNQYPETILICAEPPNVRTYLRIKRLLAQIQQELDEAWTVIGEVYTYGKKFQEFGLTIRRVRSNLDDEEAFAQKVKYIPCHAAFDVADSDLLKLLIRPLYGGKPEIGIRELMQNSLDAVRELEEYRKIHPELKDIELTEQEGDVVISIDQQEDESWWVTVSDRGIGMTVDTVINYFLKAGASLRRSELWRETFEDKDGKSRVLRSGRFGVGVLAAYLLGEEISVATRHVIASEGVEFSTKLDAEYIELKRIKRPVGTTIRVKISNEVKDALYGVLFKFVGRELRKEESWDWYCLTSPTVVRKFCDTPLKQKNALPSLHMVSTSIYLNPEERFPFLLLWFTSGSGFSFALDPWHIQQLHSKNILLLTSYYNISDKTPDMNTTTSHSIFYACIDTKLEGGIDRKKIISHAISFYIDRKKLHKGYSGNFEVLENLTIPEKRILISRHTLRELEELREHQGTFDL